jgi:fucose 4-O-acetylase-like acetyltransferase
MVATKQRDSFFDVLKFVLIVFVILGHVVEKSLSDYYMRLLYTYIYSFHMPLFIFVSGYFSKKKERKSFLKSTLKLVETLICFQIVYLLLRYIIPNRPISLFTFCVPYGALWYLLSLIWWRIGLQLLPQKLLDKKNLMIGASILVSLLSQISCAYANVFAWQRTLGFLPFFVLGYYAQQTNIMERIRNIRPFYSIALLIIFVISVYCLNSDTLKIFQQSLFFRDMDIPNSVNTVGLRLTCRIIDLIVVSIISICVINLCNFAPKRLNNLGQNTMMFYVYHCIFIICFGALFNRLGLKDMNCYLNHLITFTLIMVILLVMDRFRIFHLLVNPISNFRQIIRLILRK